VMFLHVGGALHGDEDDAEVVLFVEGFGVDAGGPGFFMLGFGDLFGEIELGDLVDHGAVLQGGCHDSLLWASAGEFTLSLVWMRYGWKWWRLRWRPLCAGVAGGCIYLWFACWSSWQRCVSQDFFQEW